MTTIEIIWGVIGVITIILTFSFLIWISYEFTMKEYKTSRYPILENKNMTKKIDKEVNRLRKNYGQIQHEKDNLKEEERELDRQLDDIFFEIKALEDMKFKIEDNAQHDYLYRSLDEEMMMCDRVKFKQQFRRSYEAKKRDGELKPYDSEQVADEEESEEDE